MLVKRSEGSSDFLKNQLHFLTWHKAKGSIRIQEGQPPNSLSLQANLAADIAAIPEQSENATAQKSAH